MVTWFYSAGWTPRGDSDQLPGRLGLGEHPLRIQFDPVEQPAGDEMRNPFAHLVFGEDHVVRPNALEDGRVLPAHHLRPDVADLQLGGQASGEDAGLQVGADGYHGPAEVGDADLLQRVAASICP